MVMSDGKEKLSEIIKRLGRYTVYCFSQAELYRHNILIDKEFQGLIKIFSGITKIATFIV